MPSFEKAPNTPADQQKSVDELINANKLPAYKPLHELEPDQATELLRDGRWLDSLNDVHEIIAALPDDMHGKKEAIINLIGATADLIRVYSAERTDSVTSKSFSLAGLNKLRNALQGFGFKADEQ